MLRAHPRRWRRLVLVALLAALTAASAADAAPRADSGDVAFDAGLQWGLSTIRAEEAWATARGAGTVIAVVDSGVALDHEDLAARLVDGVACRHTGGDPAACSGSPDDDDGHGTHVAGIAGASAGNGVGIAGVAPDARIMPIKVLFRACPSCESTGNAADVAAAIRWAADRGADVINLSLGSTTSEVFGPSFEDAVAHAWSQGAIPVVAAGNDYVLTADLGDATAVVVSATDRDDGAPGYSNGVGNARWAVAAPGGEGEDTPETCSQQGAPRGILSTYWAVDDPDHAYACLSGTSMAAPHVSGALAVLRSAGLSPADAVAALLDTSIDIGTPGPDATFGAGRIDLAAAVAGGRAPQTSAPFDVLATGDAPTTAVPPSSADPEVGAPQLFVDDDDDLPRAPVAVAILAVGVAAFLNGWALFRLRPWNRPADRGLPRAPR